MKLSKLCQNLPCEWEITEDVDISRIHTDSRSVAPGDLFFPKQGETFDGLDFVQEAVNKGASAVLTLKELDIAIPQIKCERSFDVLKHLCLTLYDRPTEKMRVVGITGTNGKTSTCYFVERFLERQGRAVANLGSTTYRWPGKSFTAPLTTPMFETLQWYFSKMQQDDVSDVVMECSSHGIELGRVDDIAFDVCVYTNLSHEHLDFHKTMEAYAQAKEKLFAKNLNQSSKPNKCAVINIDDEIGRSWVDKKVSSKIWTYGFDPRADARVHSVTPDAKGMQVHIDFKGQPMTFRTPMLGTYNVMNLMAAMLSAHALGVDLDVMKACMEEGIAVPGRMEHVAIDAPFTVIVDYAYTEDALINILDTLRPFCSNHLITVFGCGGDRDPSRRPKMGKAVLDRSDRVIITTDNPRTEDPQSIIDEILTGIAGQPSFDQKVMVEVDRKEAIAKALHIAKEGDMVLIAGKGHETYQEIHGVRHPFDDREVVRTCWNN